MRQLLTILSLALVLASLSACRNGRLNDADPDFPDESSEQSSSDLPRDFTLSAGETVLVNDVNFQFERVEQDNRCPKGTQCITAGLAKVVVSYTVVNDPQQKVLSFSGGHRDKTTLNVGDMKLTLGFLKPYPAPNIKIDPASYQAHFIAYQDSSSSEGALENAVVIDVRTQEEYDAGHFSDATLIPYDQIAQKIGGLELDKEQTIVVYCRSGNRAGKAKDTLQSMGYDNVINAVDKDVTEHLFRSGE